MASLVSLLPLSKSSPNNNPLTFFPRHKTKSPRPSIIKSTSSNISSIITTPGTNSHPKTLQKSSTDSLITTHLNDNRDHSHDHDHDHDDQEMITRPALAEVWREVQGSNNWEGLLDPLDPNLRREILRYGEFAQACYDSFDFDPHSKYCGTCKYTGAHFFDRLGMSDRGYSITRYLYATSNIDLPNFFRNSSRSPSSGLWSRHANWMGYVAVSDDESSSAAAGKLGRRDILIAWRGTVTYLEWLCDLKDILSPAGFARPHRPDVKVESGFLDLYTNKDRGCRYCSFSAREQVLAEVKRLIDHYDGEEISITITGHSLGSALAILSAYDIAEVGLNSSAAAAESFDDKNKMNNIPVTVYSFAGPRVGNLKFKERCEEVGVKVLRVVNAQDVVPTVPGIIANEKVKFQKYIEDAMSFPWSYAHVGAELVLDQSRSPFLKAGSKDPGSAHNLEVHLHLVDGYQGKGDKKFRLATKRDIALVNKNCDLLRPDYGVPPNWRQDENKGMVRNADGRWVLPDRHRLEGHPPDTAHHLHKIAALLNNNTTIDHSRLEAA